MKAQAPQYLFQISNFPSYRPPPPPTHTRVVSSLATAQVWRATRDTLQDARVGESAMRCGMWVRMYAELHHVGWICFVSVATVFPCSKCDAMACPTHRRRKGEREKTSTCDRMTLFEPEGLPRPAHTRTAAEGDSPSRGCSHKPRSLARGPMSVSGVAARLIVEWMAERSEQGSR